MIYTEAVIAAAQKAVSALHGTYDSDGMPRILHAVHAAECAQTEQETVNAFLFPAAAGTGILTTEMTVRAARIAENAHFGQQDRTGMPYILHPAHLAAQLDSEVTVTAALLHDVAEDTAVTLSDLEKEFPAAVMAVLRLLTHTHGEDYTAYLLRLKENPDAFAVKCADLKHNMDESRILPGTVSDAQLKKWREKYARASAVLFGGQ